MLFTLVEMEALSGTLRAAFIENPCVQIHRAVDTYI